MSRAELAKYSVSLHSWIADVKNKNAVIRAIQSAIDAYITEYENAKNPFSDSGETEISWANTFKNTYSAVVEKISSNTSQFFQDVPKIQDTHTQLFDPIHFLLTLNDRVGSWSVGLVRSSLKVKIIAAISSEHVASFRSKQLKFVESGGGFVDVPLMIEHGPDGEEQAVVDEQWLFDANKQQRDDATDFDAEAIELAKAGVVNPLEKSDHAFKLYEYLLNHLMRDSRHVRQKVDAATLTEDLSQSSSAKSVAARR